MKKNFLLLLLMTLLPLAGWAQPKDLSDGWEIVFDPTGPVTYTGADQTPAVKLKKGENYLTSGFNVEWSSTEIKNAGSYTVTVTADNTNTYDDLATPTKKFWILKANSALTNTPAVINGFTWDGKEHNLVKTAPTVSFGTVEYSLDQQNWSSSAPKAKDTGTYSVYYRVQGTDNWNGIASTKIGDVVVNGQNITATAPTAVDGLKYTGVAQNLIAAGTVTEGQGTMKYRLGTSDAWSTTLPQATNAGNYTVQWMVEAAEGYNDIAATNVAVSIAAVAPTVSEATGATGLTYNKNAQALLSAAATASLNAPVKYQISTDGGNTWGAATAYANVKGTNAGTYKIKAIVEAGGNFLAAAGDAIDVTIAQKQAAAPAAIAGLVYNKNAQALITAGEEGIVLYSFNGGAWTTSIDGIKGTNAGDYNVQYKVEDANYKAVAATAISNVKIAKAYLTVVVKDVEKTYDATVNYPAAISAADYECIATVDDYDVTGIAYKATTKKAAGVYEEEVDVTIPAANANYEVNIVKGKLTINKAKLTVTANTGLTCDMNANAANVVKNEYVVAGVQGGEANNVVWKTLPVLTSDAPATLVPGEYTLSFTKGTLKSANYEMSEAGDGGYVVPAAAKLTVTPAAGSKVLITVVGHSKTYGENDPDYTKWVAGTDYYVSGLAAGDAIASIEFSREAGENVGQYTLSATATVNHPEWYASAIVYNNSTLTIGAKELVATVGTQYVTVGTTPEALPDADAWSVTGLEFDDTKEDLAGTLSIPAGAFAATGEYDITLAINNTNYTLKAGSNIGKLIVIASDVLALDDTQADNFEKIVASNGKTLNVTMALKRDQDLPAGTTRTWTAGRWNSLILPFDITIPELSAAFGYAIFNVVDEANSKEGSVKFKLEMGIDGAIKANTPILIKTMADYAGAQVINFGTREIVAPAAAKVEKAIGSTGYKFVGTYETVAVDNATPDYHFWIGSIDAPAHIGASSANTWNVLPFACYIDQTANANVPAADMIFTFEDIDGNTTAIRGISSDNADKVKAFGEGWYNLNGVKLQGAPTEKGIYIKDGKKVVLK